MKDQILKLRGEGKTYNQIKELLGCSKGTISYHCGEGQLEKSREYSRDKKRRDKDFLNSIKSNLKCEKCPEDRYWVLDFHHVDPNIKDGKVSALIRNFGRKRVLKEIDKCIVLCSNCHRDLHYQEKKLL